MAVFLYKFFKGNYSTCKVKPCLQANNPHAGVQVDGVSAVHRLSPQRAGVRLQAHILEAAKESTYQVQSFSSVL